MANVYCCLILFVFVLCLVGDCHSESDENNAQDTENRFRLDGKVTIPSTVDKEWTSLARVLVDGGQFLGLLKPDGSFAVTSIPSGSYIVEVSHPRYVFDPARVEISSKGKIRARSLNNVQPSTVHSLNYPLRFKARGEAQYFEKREQWRLTDFLFNPMMMMMILPLGLMLVLPKLINSQDPEVQREMQSMNMLQPQQNLPDPAELLTKWFGGGASGSSGSSGAKKKEIKNKPSKKVQ